MPAFFIKTYGCQMNERDSEQVATQLRQRGYTAANSEAEADVVLLNTCSVRDMAEQKAIAKMQNLQGRKRKNPGLVIGFMGCMAQSRGGELATLIPKVDMVVGTQKYHKVADYIDQLFARQNPDMDSLRQPIVDTAEEAGSQNTIKDHALTTSQVTAFVSIMQGCNMHCTFCIVPSTRGAERSRPINEIVAEVRSLVTKGVKEVTLLGQIVNQYGRHEFPAVDGKTPFTQLLYALEEIDGLERIRFTSPHPIGYKKDLIQAFRELKKLCEHIHLPLQSGSDRILKAMHRTYTADKYRRLVDEIRAASPGIAITTDIIVGFPGETEEDYQATRKLVEDVRFDNAFIFRYSERRNTPAADYPDKVAEEIKDARNKDLLGVIDVIAEQNATDLMGKTVEILVEGPSKTKASRLMGRTRTNKLVIFEGDNRHRGQILPVKIIDNTAFTFYGDPVIHL
ncbi:MAG: tRNA (N6-isopentenyl adenosine(37)-C2)-methylthiotransferase MiaB [Verrucomicrobiales bacterium]|jgi:tRNA-2-methylthio-N6-dimethylallyladenosine synthase|nr:tRNA (N6-isopentenyl adenosine(37)-C2)-methylthiotransferase MiaB [Verrucomicrobiales bacterium]